MRNPKMVGIVPRPRMVTQENSDMVATGLSRILREVEDGCKLVTMFVLFWSIC